MPGVNGLRCLCFISFCACFCLISDEWKALLYQHVSQWLPSVCGPRSFVVVGGSGFIDLILSWISCKSPCGLCQIFELNDKQADRKEKCLFLTCARMWIYLLRTSLAARGLTFLQALIGLMASSRLRQNACFSTYETFKRIYSILSWEPSGFVSH